MYLQLNDPFREMNENDCSLIIAELMFLTNIITCLIIYSIIHSLISLDKQNYYYSLITINIPIKHFLHQINII